ncbi:hypothetical protein Tco_0051205 [Tanacetum coccineum]
MPSKRSITSEAPAMTQAAIRKLVADSVDAALEAQELRQSRLLRKPNRTPILLELLMKMGTTKKTNGSGVWRGHEDGKPLSFFIV